MPLQQSVAAAYCSLHHTLMYITRLLLTRCSLFSLLASIFSHVLALQHAAPLCSSCTRSALTKRQAASQIEQLRRNGHAGAARGCAALACRKAGGHQKRGQEVPPAGAVARPPAACLTDRQSPAASACGNKCTEVSSARPQAFSHGCRHEPTCSGMQHDCRCRHSPKTALHWHPGCNSPIRCPRAAGP